MTVTMIDLDDEALELARLYYGTATKKDTVNHALRDAAERLRRRRSELGDFLLEQAAEYDAMDPTQRADFRALMTATDRTFDDELTRPGKTPAARRGRGRDDRVA